MGQSQNPTHGKALNEIEGKKKRQGAWENTVQGFGNLINFLILSIQKKKFYFLHDVDYNALNTIKHVLNLLEKILG